MKFKTAVLMVALLAAPIVRCHAVQPCVVTTTSVLSSLVAQIGAGAVRTVTLLPSGCCPAQFDLSVADVRELEKSGVLFAHGYEPYLAGLKKTVRNPAFTVYLFPEDGNWQVPDIQASMAGRVAERLSLLYPGDAARFSEQRAVLERRLHGQSRTLRKSVVAAGLKGRPVICDNFLKDILVFLGLDVVAVYGRPEDLSAVRMSVFLREGKKAGVRLVVDNLQAGPDTGKEFAREFGAVHVVFSNFPGGFPGTTTLEDTLRENVRRLLSAYGKHL